MSTQLTVDTSALLHNLRLIKELAEDHGISVSVVTKGLTGNEALVRLLVQNGADSICEAHIQNLLKWDGLAVEKWLIRSPLASESEEAVRYADVSLVSEQIILGKLSEAARRQGRVHKIVIMLELGELREGCMPGELVPLCESCLSLPGIELHGIGANLSCINDIIPDESNMKALADSAAKVEDSLGIKLPLISGGSSSAIKMLSEGKLPAQINHLRIGEAILLGNIVCYDIPFEGARTDVFSLKAEIIEVKEKPSLPWSARAPGATPVASDPACKDRGIRKRALIAVGKQDVYSKYLIPEDPAIEILGDTSDCLITDVTDCETKYKPGDTVSFNLRYNGLVSALASDYVDIVLL